MEKRSMPICFTKDQYKKLEEFGKKHGMLHHIQVVEQIRIEA